MAANDSETQLFGVPQERDWNSLSEEEFRAIVRDEFSRYPHELRHPSHRLLWSQQREWHQGMAAKGWIAPSWPTKFGGMGLRPRKLLTFLEEQDRAGIARFQDHGVRMVGPALIAFGTERQLQTFLPPILTCEARYCQGYSEPDAGSDLTSLRTTARPSGDGWVIRGTKTWTTMAHDVTHIFALARTGREGARRDQLTFFLIPLDTPGISVRTIRDIAGGDELCEVHFDDVCVPTDNVIGAVNGGWQVANAVLGFERIHIGSPQLPESALISFESLARLTGLQSDPLVAAQRGAFRLDVAHLKAVYEEYATALEREQTLGPDVSMLKLWATETFQRIAAGVIDLAGSAGGIASEVQLAGHGVEVLGPYYRALPSTIYGGSSEVQRNILARRVLALPTV